LAVFGCTLDDVTTESDPLAAFRVNLKHCREELGLTYEEAGKRAGISGQRWRNIENGYEMKAGVRIPANPRRGNLIKMARAVEITAEEALSLAGQGPLKPVEVRQLSERPRAELKQLINELSEDQVRALLHVALTMHASPSNPETANRGVRVTPGSGKIPEQRDDVTRA
jgi:transcriptional regulator with XRE-family HTH domain